MNRVLSAVLFSVAGAASVHAVVVDTPVACKRLQIRTSRIDPTLVRLRWTCPVQSATLPLPSPTAEPTAGIGTLFLTNAAGTQYLGVYSLPRAGWRKLGTPTNPKGFRFNGFVSGADRVIKCRVAISPTGLSANCTVFVNPSLPVAYPLAVTLTTLGESDQQRYCAEFGGTEQSNNAQGLVRIDAPAPAACPALL